MKIDDQLADEVSNYYADPLGFVLFAFDWNKGDLKGFNGPDKWQRDRLNDIAFQVKSAKFNGINPVAPIRQATSSGHGIGKSALTAWLILWVMSTRPYSKGVVTANTSEQLRTKTWGELGKWRKRCITGHWFEYNNGKGNMNLYRHDNAESWRVDAQTCREENSESFAGLHAANSTPFYIFDEASAVPNKIWEVAEGGLTDGEPMWFCFGNPTRNSGKFFECFNKQKHRWHTARIDSRKAKMTNKKIIQEWIDDYGEDSDFVRVRVRGVFPRSGTCQFISSEEVSFCNEYKAEGYQSLPLVIGVDVARFGDDQSVICIRQGRKAAPLLKFRGLDTMQLADKVIENIRKYQPDGLLIDGGGVGGGVIDRLSQLGYDVIEVNFGGKPSDDKQYSNKRAEMWGRMRDAIKAGMQLPSDDELTDELTHIEYGFNAKQQIQLEKKQDMKKRGLSSPDCADALALTYAEFIDLQDEEDGDDFSEVGVMGY